MPLNFRDSSLAVIVRRELAAAASRWSDVKAYLEDAEAE